ncbi:helicase-related protein [Helicobacter mesocricetorum]|uniref:helicase-related protein n=1 Tax=Helicobacter mesocricetorum TaxID=87012 RepID=UPI000CF05AE1|nr:helicase-related protein [Helicobacter mesocricetorum]
MAFNNPSYSAPHPPKLIPQEGNCEMPSNFPSNFTTNQGNNTLLNQFKNALSSKDVENLAFLVGFFRISGFIHLHTLLKDSGYERFKNIRILVGMEVDNLLYELSQNNLDPKHQEDKFKKLFYQSQKEFLNKEDYKEEIEQSIQALIDALNNVSFCMRMVREKNVHSKYYVFYSNPKENFAHKGRISYEGALIVGSSNLTHNGLEKNFEFNLQSKDSDDIACALCWFEKLWEDSIEICKADIEKCREESFLKVLPVRDIYHKLLLCHFGEEFLKDDPSLRQLFKNYAPYEYQIGAIKEGISKLKKYNGFFLSDVVGLGKTLIASIIAKKCRNDGIIEGKIVIIAPPAVENAWKRHFDAIEVANYHFISKDSLYKIDDKEAIELVIVDESHNFSNEESNRYKHLKDLCQTPYKKTKKPKKIILLSATPQKNRPKDIANQIFLFLPDNFIIEGINLSTFLSNKDKDFKNILKELKQDIEEKHKRKLYKKLKENSEELRDKLLVHIMIRRTRKDIEEYYKEDMQKAELSFPEAKDPIDLPYQFNKQIFKLVEETLDFVIEKETSKGIFTYSRYLVFDHLTEEGKAVYKGGSKKDDDFFSRTGSRLYALMRQLYFKRFDSSLYAFKQTLQRGIDAYKEWILGFEKGEIKISKNPKKEKEPEEEYFNESFDTEDGGEIDLEITLKVEHFEKGFLQKLKNDKKILEYLLKSWEAIEEDPKCKRLQDFIKNSKDSNQKIIIFTEYSDTAKYLADTLKSPDVIQVDASNREEKRKTLEENFDANYDESKQKNDFRILITTDTLAEGVNLHRADTIINYDSPYNPTRLMQRIGRINRIGAKHKQIHIYHFKPDEFIDSITNIISIIQSKLASFHETYGGDYAIYDSIEQVGSKEIYSIQKLPEEEVSKDTKHKRHLRDLYLKDKKEFERIKALPLKSRTIIEVSQEESKSFAYIKQNKNHRDIFYPYEIVGDETDIEAKKCDFYTMADFLHQHLECEPLECEPATKSLHYKHIDKALEQYQESTKAKSTLKDSNPKPKQNAFNKLKSLNLDESKKEILRAAIDRGDTKVLNAIKECKPKELENLQNLTESLAKINLGATASEPNGTQEAQNIQKPQIQISITAIATKEKE